MTVQTNLEIKLAGVKQLDELASMFDAYRVWYGKESNLPAGRYFLFERTINHESVAYIAYEQEKPVGFVQLYPCFSSININAQWVLNDLFVIPEARQKGVGKALMQACIKLAQERGDLGLVLETGKNNTHAKALYEKLGFKLDTEFDRYTLTL